jgi:site-specific DNA-cytosine methylase
MRKLKMLDCFCGLGGASEGFHREGFDVTGIDIVNVGYPYRFILANMLSLDGKAFQGYDVIWGSPPCREFTPMITCFAKNWKKAPNLQEGLKLVDCFLTFIQRAKPRFWIMENHPNLAKHIHTRPQFVGKLSKGMRRAFWGNCPDFLFPMSNKPSIWRNYNNHKTRSWERAKIPLACSQTFARACKEALEEVKASVPASS